MKKKFIIVFLKSSRDKLQEYVMKNM